jgi:Fur family ferric uptake transcriptional regulator
MRTHILLVGATQDALDQSPLVTYNRSHRILYMEIGLPHHLETEQQLRQKGYRLTPQRLAVLEVIKAGQGHMTVPEILERLRVHYPTLTVPTVYRSLQWLQKVGLVAETDLGGDCHVYEFIAENHHHHLVCVRCRRVVDLPSAFLEPLCHSVQQEYGFIPCLEHVGLFGLCPDCQREAGKAGEPQP